MLPITESQTKTPAKPAGARRWRGLIMGGLVAALAVAGTMSAVPAQAYEHHFRGHWDHGRFFGGPPFFGFGVPGFYVPPPVVYAPPPQAYYAPPPVYYAPQPSLNVVVPLRIR